MSTIRCPCGPWCGHDGQVPDHVAAFSLGSISSSDVAWTRQSSTPFMQSTPLTTLSDALHQAGPELLHPMPAVVKCIYLVPSVVGNATADKGMEGRSVDFLYTICRYIATIHTYIVDKLTRSVEIVSKKNGHYF